MDFCVPGAARIPLSGHAYFRWSHQCLRPQRIHIVHIVASLLPDVWVLVRSILRAPIYLHSCHCAVQMMRGAEMLFAALFSVVFLGRTLNRFHLLGIFFCSVWSSPVARGSASALIFLYKPSSWLAMPAWQPHVLLHIVSIRMPLQNMAAQLLLAECFIPTQAVLA